MADFSVVFFHFASSHFSAEGSTSEADDITKTRIAAVQVTIIYRCLGTRCVFFGGLFSSMGGVIGLEMFLQLLGTRPALFHLDNLHECLLCYGTRHLLPPLSYFSQDSRFPFIFGLGSEDISWGVKSSFCTFCQIKFFLHVCQLRGFLHVSQIRFLQVSQIRFWHVLSLNDQRNCNVGCTVRLTSFFSLMLNSANTPSFNCGHHFVTPMT